MNCRTVTGQRNQILACSPVLAGIRTASILNEIPQEGLPVDRRGLYCSDRCDEMALDTIGVSNYLAVATLARQSTRRGHFKGHTDAALKRRPGIAVSRVVGVINGLSKILKAKAVEPLGVVATIGVKHLPLCIDVVGIEGLSRWREKIA